MPALNRSASAVHYVLVDPVTGDVVLPIVGVVGFGSTFRLARVDLPGRECRLGLLGERDGAGWRRGVRSGRRPEQDACWCTWEARGEQERWFSSSGGCPSRLTQGAGRHLGLRVFLVSAATSA